MAVTINQSPGTVRQSIGEIAFSVLSDNINEVNFSYVVDVYDGVNRIHRAFKQANPVGYGVFDLSRIINDQLTYDVEALGTSVTVTGVNSTKTYTVRFGERYRVTRSGVVDDNPSLFTDLTVSNSFTVIKAVQEHNRVAPTASVYSADTLLSIVPSEPQRVVLGDSQTISYYDVSSNATLHVPIEIPASVGNYTQTVNGTAYSFEILPVASAFGHDRFVWINDNGGWDYFTADQENTPSVTVNKESFESTTLDWGRSTLSNRHADNSNAFRGGTTNYRTDVQTLNTRNTRWLSPSEALLVEGIFTSKSVYKQVGTNFIPVTIVNSSYNKIPSLRNPQNFQYPIQWREASDIRTR